MEVLEAENEEEVIRYYFNHGYKYDEILCFLNKYHSINLSYRTFLRRLQLYNLRRRNTIGTHPQLTNGYLRNKIRNLINGPASAGGYRVVWHFLEMDGIRVPRSIVRTILKELDPEGVERRRSHRLRRRKYSNPGPNFAWHIDGYDKLKPWGFPIHGAIDGFSRRM